MSSITRLFVCVVALVAAAIPGYAQGKGGKRATMDAFVQAARHGSERPSVIVRHRPGAGARLQRRFASHGDRIRQQLDNIDAIAVELHPEDIDKIVQDPDVVGVSANAIVATGAKPKAAPPAPLDHLTTAELRQTLGLPTRGRETGKNVGIAILDSGIELVKDLKFRVTAYYDFTGGGSRPSDGYGHGTHLAALIAGSGSSSNGKYAGLAPGARLIVLKVLDENGRGYTSDVISAIDFAVANRVKLGIDIINLSLGHPVFEPAATDLLVQAVDRASAAGIVVVVSAGNFGRNPETGQIGAAGVSSPGNSLTAITAGSSLTHGTVSPLDDAVAPFSGRGPTWHDGRLKPDLIAPGDRIVAATKFTTKLYQNPKLRAEIGNYLKLSGTSVSTAITSAVVALMIEANRVDERTTTKPLTPNTVKALLQYSALPVQPSGTGIPAELERGAGALNAHGAIALARAIEPKAKTGTWWMEVAVAPTSTIGGVVLPWAQQVIWGNGVVWGNAALFSWPAWKQGVIWGTDDGVLWGDSVVLPTGNLVIDSFSLWSSIVVWGNNLVQSFDDGLVWGDLDEDGVLWGDSDDGVLWGDDDDGVVWGGSLGVF